MLVVWSRKETSSTRPTRQDQAFRMLPENVSNSSQDRTEWRICLSNELKEETRFTQQKELTKLRKKQRRNDRNSPWISMKPTENLGMQWKRWSKNNCKNWTLHLRDKCLCVTGVHALRLHKNLPKGYDSGCKRPGRAHLHGHQRPVFGNCGWFSLVVQVCR